MDETSTPHATAEAALKRRLLKRIGIAAVMVAALLGSLAVFDAIYAPRPPAADKLAAVPPAGEAPPPAEPAKAAPAADTKPEPAVAAPAPAEPEGTTAAAAPPLPPLPAEKPLTRPATGRAASIRSFEPAAAPAARPEPARELAQEPIRHAPASRPVTRAGERQLALQLGVFGNLANAEELHAKLESHGIPSTLEARVRVGPFRTRQEVEAARARLKELGFDPGMLVSIGK